MSIINLDPEIKEWPIIPRVLRRYDIEKAGGKLISSRHLNMPNELWELPCGTLFLGSVIRGKCGEIMCSDVFTELDLETKDIPGWAIDDYLCSRGYDPDEVKHKFQELAEEFFDLAYKRIMQLFEE